MENAFEMALENVEAVFEECKRTVEHRLLATHPSLDAEFMNLAIFQSVTSFSFALIRLAY